MRAFALVWFLFFVFIVSGLTGYTQVIRDYKKVIQEPFPTAEKFADRSFGQKFGRASWEVLSMEAASSLFMIVMPRSFTNWEDQYWLYFGEKLKRAWTAPPVWDHDIWVANYLGHPYQGAVFYNSLRSQQASFWLSSGNVLFHTWLWEYVIEAVMEQPSIQDLIVTPVAGIFFGELFHYLTLKFSRNGFTTLEKILVILINPCYAINCGFSSTFDSQKLLK